MSRPLAALAGAAAAAALLAAAPGHGAARAGNPRAATVQKVFPSAVRIQLAAGGEVVRRASGVAFAREGDATYVLTNAHVVEPGAAWKGSAEVRVLAGGDGAPLPARVVARGHLPDLDLAVLEVRGAALPVTPLAAGDGLALGDDLVVIGAPFGKGLSVAAGIVSQVEYEHAESAGAPPTAASLKTDAAIGYGSSGAGIFDVPEGRLVGLVEGYRTARVQFGKDEGYALDVPMPGETFAAPAAKIRRFLAAQGLGRLAPGGAAAAAAPAPAPEARAASRM